MIPLEMAGVQAWATTNNQVLNVTKTPEIILKRKNKFTVTKFFWYKHNISLQLLLKQNKDGYQNGRV